MKHSIIILSALLLCSCLCTPRADSVRIDGLFIVSDSTYLKSSQNPYIINANFNWHFVDGGKQICLTYNKEKAADIELNQVINSSIRLICDKTINSTLPGNNIKNSQIDDTKATSFPKSILYGISNDDLVIGEIYNFKMTCTTTDSLHLQQNFKLKILP
ncbi:MAG: hypothetical protein IT245_00420 [Bacteroidia bacterium]|nr:hypothetical protein [Bacteroidia bacterium]